MSPLLGIVSLFSSALSRGLESAPGTALLPALVFAQSSQRLQSLLGLRSVSASFASSARYGLEPQALPPAELFSVPAPAASGLSGWHTPVHPCSPLILSHAETRRREGTQYVLRLCVLGAKKPCPCFRIRFAVFTYHEKWIRIYMAGKPEPRTSRASDAR